MLIRQNNNLIQGRKEMYIAIKEIKKEKVRFGMIISVIVLISFLVFFLSSLAYGLSQLNRTAIDHWDVDGVIITESSNKNLYSSQINLFEIENLKNENVEYLTVSTSNAKINESQTLSLTFMGYEDENSWIIPKLIDGEINSEKNEVVITNNIKEKYSVSVGDKLVLSNTDRVFNISGFTENSNFNTLPVVYGHVDDVSSVILNYDTSLSKLDANASATENMPQRINAVMIKDRSILNEADIPSGLMFVDTESLVESLPGYLPQLLTFGLMIFSLSVIAAVIVGIFIFILTMQKKSIFAVLKIQGYQNGTIISSIIFQIILLTTTGLLIGFIFNLIAVESLSGVVPVLINYQIITYVSAAIIAMSLLGAVFSAYSVLKIDPLESL